MAATSATRPTRLAVAGGERQGEEKGGDEQEHEARDVAVENEGRQMGHLAVDDLRLLGGDVEQLHDVIVHEAHDRLVEAELDQEERDPDQEPDQRRLGEHARLGVAA